MDISKLPRLSRPDSAATPPPSPSAAPPSHPSTQQNPLPVQRVVQPTGPGTVAYAEPASLVEAWISICVGVVLFYLNTNTWGWISAHLFHTKTEPLITDVATGRPVPYVQSNFFWGDLGTFLFALVMLLDGLVFAFLRKRALMWGVFALTLAATAYQFIYVVVSYQRMGLALVSLLAAMFGVYIAVYQYRALRPNMYDAHE